MEESKKEKIRKQNFITGSGMILVIVFCFSFVLGSVCSQKGKPDIRALGKKIIQQRAEFDTIRNVIVTVYQSTKEQCGNDKGIGYSGRKMQWGDIAISQQLQFDHLNNGDKVYISEFDKVFTVSDATSNKLGGYVIDVWIPLDSKIRICKKNCVILKLKT
jgi:hypothetical protein